MNRALDREKAAVDIATRQNFEFNSNLENLKMQLERAKKLDDDRVQMVKQSVEKASAAEKALEEGKKAYAELEKSFNEFKVAAQDAATKSAQEIDAAKNAAVLSEQKVEAANELVTAAEGRAAAAEARAVEAEKNALKCYEQGIYHMARCWWRDISKDFTPDLEELALYSLENSISEELLAYHSVIPFTPAEIERINGRRRSEGLAEIEFGEVALINMRSIQDDMEAIGADPIAAGQATAETVAAVDGAGVGSNVGEVPQIDAAGGVENPAQVTDPLGGSEAKEGEGSQTAGNADGAAS